MRSGRKLLLLLTPAILCMAAVGSGDPPNDLLRGPEVSPSARAQGMPMAGSGPQRRAFKRQAVPVRRWMVEFGQMPLKDDQRKAFERLTKSFSARAQVFKETHGTALANARKELKQLYARQAATEIAPDTQLIERMRALQSTIRKIEAKAPMPENLQMSCWMLLDNPQQDLLRVRLKTIRDQLSAERARKEQRRGMKGMQEDDVPPMQPDGMQGMQEVPKGSF